MARKLVYAEEEFLKHVSSPPTRCELGCSTPTLLSKITQPLYQQKSPMQWYIIFSRSTHTAPQCEYRLSWYWVFNDHHIKVCPAARIKPMMIPGVAVKFTNQRCCNIYMLLLISCSNFMTLQKRSNVYTTAFGLRRFIPFSLTASNYISR